MRRPAIIALTLSLLAACNPLAFDEISEGASTRVLPRPDSFSSRLPFGAALTGYEVTLDGERVSRVAVGGGPGAPVLVYRGWSDGDIILGAPLFDACDDSGDCLEGAGGALIGVPVWRAMAPTPSEGCVMITAPDEGGFSITCETTQLTENIPGTMMDIELGASGASLGEGSAVGVALLGAPRANAGAGGVFRVQDARGPSEIALPAGTAPPGSRLGTDIATVSLDATRALVAATAPEARRVVVFTVTSDGTTEVHACIDDPTAGFGGSVALGDVDGDGATDVIVGYTAEGPDEVAVYAGSAMPAAGCGAWGAAKITVSCPELPNASCNGSGFGADVAVGDVDGDGIGDLAIGAPFSRVDGEDRAGAVFFVPGAAGGPDASAATVRTHSQPQINDEVGTTVAMFPSGIGVAPRMEPVASSIGRQAVLAFLCTGLPGDTPGDTDVVSDRCVPR